MRQFDVFRSAHPGGPLLVVLQADELSHFNVVASAPLYPVAQWEKPTRHLQPVVTVAGESMILATNHLAAVPRTILGEYVASLAEYRTDIIAALDFLFTGV
ncbi:CcdB family protein [Magnetospirillum aberrantis]|uniref:Toxin CcdB n=1 Tax=Magnetospirillum aberrantis SpK TaxID=908842 RepID=A0A7C9QVK1_9PROT|nr:CcdB family protein [Magnetospirillum aberrantis]NFV81680.1 plasmid maintenance protein CcdB [Magnetospirillum aberrantis SpK]